MAPSKKLASLQQSLIDIERELKTLGKFRPTKQLELLQASEQRTQKEIQQRAAKANKNRSEKMKRSWRYFKAIQENYYPERSLREIRSLFSQRRKGLETDVPDVAWRNPSP